jgi:hypothetical protein
VASEKKYSCHDKAKGTSIIEERGVKVHPRSTSRPRRSAAAAVADVNADA